MRVSENRWCRPLLLGAVLLAACARPATPRKAVHSPTVAAVLAQAAPVWASQRTRHVTMYAPQGSDAAQRLPSLAAQAEAARAYAIRALHAPPDTLPHLEVALLPSREAMRPFTGGTPGGWALTEEEALLVAADAGDVLPFPHEVMHIVSWRTWGTPAGHWLSEGVAMLAAPVCAGTDMDDLAAGLLQDGLLVPLDAFPGEFSTASAAHYVQAGSLVRFVYHTYGVEGLRRLWTSGLRRTPDALGLSRDALDAAWQASLLDRVPARATPHAYRRIGCAPAKPA